MAQPRTKARIYQPKNGGEKRAMIYTPTVAQEWRDSIQSALYPFLRTYRDITVPVEVVIVFRFPRPMKLQTTKAWATYNIPHTTKPDRDNLEKAVLDEITTLDKIGGHGIWKDDAQVWRGMISKRYVNAGEEPGMHLKIYF